MVVAGALFNYIEWRLVEMDWVKLLDTVGVWANAVGGLANAVGILVGAIVAIFTIRKVEPALRPRNRLKADLESMHANCQTEDER